MSETQLPLDGNPLLALPGTRRKGLPEVWASSITSLMAGDSSCGYRSWVKAHYAKFTKREGDFDFARWKVEHTTLLDEIAARLKREGWQCSLEDANRCRLTGKSSTFVMKPDLVARKGGRVKIVDAKSGKPKQEHIVQVALYMLALPMVWGRVGMPIDGEVVYGDHTVDVDAAQAEHFREPFFRIMRRMGSPEPEPTQPGPSECRYCDVLDCPSRVGDTVPTTKTELF